MKRLLPAAELARDSRFWRVRMEERMADPRLRAQAAAGRDTSGPLGGRLTPSDEEAPDRARSLMHGIFVGELQALEGAARTCWDFDDDQAPFDLKLNMARQAWDEARHVEISVKLAEHMGTDIGEFAESTFLYEAACNEDPVLRLAGVNRGLEGLAIDVFNAMREFAQQAGDPVLEFCEDWMLADEVTHVKFGSDWVRRLTENDPERRKRAIEFQQTVDRLFSLGGARSDDGAIRLARQFRRLAGFTEDEIDQISALGTEVREETARRRAELQQGAYGS